MKRGRAPRFAGTVEGWRGEERDIKIETEIGELEEGKGKDTDAECEILRALSTSE